MIVDAAQPAWTSPTWRRELAAVLDRLRRLRQRVDRDGDGPRDPSPAAALAVVGEGDGIDAFGQVVGAFATSLRDVQAIALALAAEVNGEVSRLISFFDGDTDGRPSLRLADALWEGSDASADVAWMADFAHGPAVACGLVQLEGSGALPVRTMKIAADLVPRLLAPVWTPPRTAGLSWLSRGALDRVEVSPAQREVMDRWRQAAPRGPLVVAGAEQSGRSTVARHAAAGLGLDVLEVDVEACGGIDTIAKAVLLAQRESRWRPCAVLFSLGNREEPPWPALHNAIAAVDAPRIIEVPLAWADRACESAQGAAMRLVNALPSWQQRSEHWSSLAGGDITAAESESLAARFPLAIGPMHRAVQRASSVAPGEHSFATLEASCRDISAEVMTDLAERLPQAHERADLVVGADIERELDLAVAWVQRQGHVMERWGYRERISLGRGLTAQFSGPPGTGKTMAAQVLARELGMEIFRVDLSRVVDKYIGETEKNLGRLFDKARASGGILFFDEADALFGRRSAVKDAHDRHANLEVGYLLQRMESHEGVTILATNRGADMDDAFARRFHIRLAFPRPTATQRARIWTGMFPAEAACSDTLSLSPFADAFDFTGGEIRNAALCAAYLAAAEESVICNRHLVAASLRELRKQGISPSQRCQRIIEGLPA